MNEELLNRIQEFMEASQNDPELNALITKDSELTAVADMIYNTLALTLTVPLLGIAESIKMAFSTGVAWERYYHQHDGKLNDLLSDVNFDGLKG